MRLVAPAGAAWGSSVLVLTYVPANVQHVVAWCGLALFLAGAAGAWFGVRRHVTSVAWIGAVAMASAVAVMGASLHTVAITQEPLASWARSHETVVVDGVVTTEVDVRSIQRAAVWQDRSIRQAGLATTRVCTRTSVLDVEVPIQMRVKDQAAVPAPGTLVTVRGQLISTNSRSLAGILVVDSIIVRAGPGVVDMVTHAMREGLLKAIAGLPTAPGALVAGLATGDDSTLPPEVSGDMQSAGLSHLTAVSGGNLAIVLGLVLGLSKILRLALGLRVVLGLASLAIFVVLVGPQPSVLRSAVMGAVIVVSILSGGRRAGPSVLAFAVLTLVVVSPDLAVSWGFTLSVLATAGLILISPHLQVLLDSWQVTRTWPTRVRKGIALTVAAQIATLPALASMGAFAGWASVPANLLAEPVVAPVTILGLLAAVLSPLWPGAAAAVAHVAALPAAWLVWVAHTSISLPFASVGWPTGWAGVLLCCVITLAVVVSRAVHRRFKVTRPWWIAVTALVLVSCSIALHGRRGWPPPDWFLIMCDIGQGDAIVLRAGDHEGVLVDTGPDPASVDRCLSDAGITRLPAIVLTHFHADHVNGLPGAMHDRSVGTVLVTPVREPVPDVRDVDTWTRGIPVSTITSGDMRVIGDVSWRALWPAKVITAGSVPNNASIVLDVVVAGERVLLTGDIEREAQAEVVEHLHAFDVVKVPHHGSGNFASDLPVKAPAPIALISVGAGNPYGHPAQKTLDAWTQAGAMVLRTDRQGDIAVVRSPTGVSAVARG